MSDQVWWYATRAAGLMTWSTAVASVIVGLLLSTRAVKSRTGPWMLDLHRFLGGISVLFLVVHVATLPFDSFVDFGPRELFIPGESTWNPEAAAWGIIAAYALILVELTSLLRKHLSTSVWRTFHMLSVVTAIAGTYHAILGGSDVDNPLTWLVAGAGSAIVVALVAIRLKGADSSRPRRVSKADDREALLMEMQERLENLPVAADAPLAELTAEGGELPRRDRAPDPATLPTGPAPGAFERPAAAPQPTAEPIEAQANPFAAPVAEPAPPTPAPHDPFIASPPASYDDIASGHRVADPFGRGHGGPPDPLPPTPPAPAVEHDPFVATPPAQPFVPEPTPDPFEATSPPPPPTGETPIPPTAAPFLDPADLPSGASAANPFPTAAPHTPAPDPSSPFGSEPAPAMPDPFAAAPNSPATDPFATPVAPQPAADAFTTPPADPFQAPAPATPETDPFAAAPAPTPDPAPVEAPAPPPPPPVPDAVDPVTGEPDQDAYTNWLVEWLAYAEKYGEEAPEDPSRVF